MLRWILIGLGGLVGLMLLVVVGGYLALLRPDIPYETLEARYGAADGRTIEVGDVRAYYRDEGADTIATVLLLHGYGASTATWDAWAETLKGRFRVVRVDLPGHGLTRAPDTFPATPDTYADFVDQFANKLGLGPVVVVGNSMGGNVAWRLAERHPQRVAGLVLVDAAGFRDVAPSEGGGTLLFNLLASPFWGRVLQDLDSTVLARQTLKASFVDQSRVTEAMVRRYVDLSRAPGRRALLRALSLSSWSIEPASPERLAKIIAPTLVMHGAQDALVPVENGRRFASAIPGAQIIVYEGVGHLPQEEAAERSAQDLERFLAMLPPFSPLGQPLPLGVSPDGPGQPLKPESMGKTESRPLEGVY